ncbi:MAG: anti-sigma factor family protein [Candidatus Kapaibacterium sp.]
MSYEELIHEYLDEGLDATREHALFAKLAGDTSLRAEFNKQMKLQNLALLDMHSISAPPEATSAIFNRIGFDMPGSDSQGKAGSFLKKYTGWLSALLLLLIAGGWWLADGFSGGKLADDSTADNPAPFIGSYEVNEAASENQTSKAGLSDKEAASKYEANGGGIAARNGAGPDGSRASSSGALNTGFASSARNTGTPAQDARQVSSFNKSLSLNGAANYGAANSNESNYRNISQMSPVDGMTAFNSEAVYNKTYISGRGLNAQGITDNLPATYGSEYQSGYDISGKPGKYSVQIFRFSPARELRTDIATSDDAFYNYFTIGLYYNLSRNWSVGIEGGKEPFYQEFPLTKNNVEYTRSQRPSLIYAGVAASYKIRELGFDNLYPLISGSVSYTSNGPYFRFRPALEWSILPMADIRLGIDYGILYYNIEGTLYNSSRLGINYGVNINF